MPEVTVIAKHKFAVKYLQAECGVRYWEDATINGVEDTNGTLTPLRVGEAWMPLIDIETGTIMDWPDGIEAKIHFKICDDGQYTLLDAEHNKIVRIEGYVPKIMSPGGDGYGDYVIMTIGGDGVIENWKTPLDEFELDHDV